MVKFTFSVFNRICLFWENLVQKIKIVRLNWSLVSRLVRICRIQWDGLVFTFSTCKFVQKIHLALRFYLINLTTGYSQRLEASDFSSLIYTKNNLGTKSTLQFFIWHALREFPTICLRVLCMLFKQRLQNYVELTIKKRSFFDILSFFKTWGTIDCMFLSCETQFLRKSAKQRWKRTCIFETLI